MTEAETRIAPSPASVPQQGEPCEACGSPLASDQRYCLNCGHRRGGPRVDYRHYMLTSQEPPQAAVAAPTEGEGGEEPSAVKRERDYAPLAAVGGIAVLGLMLLIGVLIGKGNGNGTAATPAPVVFKGGTGEATTASGEIGGGTASATKAAKGRARTGGKKAKGGLAGGSAGSEEATVEASTNDLEALRAESGASYEEQSRKLPNKIATPGAPPPIDKSTPPGGGEGGGEVIK